MSQPRLIPSSATEGFFQATPTVVPQYTSTRAAPGTKSSPSVADDPILSRIIALYLPEEIPAEVDTHLHQLARTCVSDEIRRWTVDAEVNVPTLHPLTTFGEVNEVDALHTGEGWRNLKEVGTRHGSVALGHGTFTGKSPQWSMRVHQMLINHLWSSSAALVTCPAAMSDGAAILLRPHLQDEDGDQPGRAQVLQEARQRLVSFDPNYAWTSGQWMTERTGGSDVSQTETTAVRLDGRELDEDYRRFGSDRDNIGQQLGPWRIDGFKWFSSATDADMVVMLARTPQGLSAFYAPMRRCRGDLFVMNGVRITRLKNKLGTKALPTSELEIKGMRAWLLGDEGKGVKEIAAILNATRIWTATGALAGLGRGLAIARAYSRVRKIQGALLQENSQHVGWMSQETVKYRAGVHLAFLGVALLGYIEQGEVATRNTRAARFLPNDQAEAEGLLRLLVPVMKAQCSLAAVNGLRACMESLGGVGYCENNDNGLDVASIFRNTCVNPIWEGTTSVMAEDVVRVLKGKGGFQAIVALEKLLKRLVAEISHPKLEQNCSVILVAWSKLKQDIEESDAAKLRYTGRSLLGRLENILCSLLLMADAAVDDDPVSVAVVLRWMDLKDNREDWGRQLDWQQQAAMDRNIFLGDQKTTVYTKASL